ncbi:hypothetical protein MIR68_011648 [Amoeboaphelidium protococcarum]|nr:hypothetical protein MIR68_011648 [Amoeboaphelidium protococcarum]
MKSCDFPDTKEANGNKLSRQVKSFSLAKLIRHAISAGFTDKYTVKSLKMAQRLGIGIDTQLDAVGPHVESSCRCLASLITLTLWFFVDAVKS